MQKHKVEVSLTLHSDSNTVEWFVEHRPDDGRWELWSEGISTPWNASSDVSDALEALLMQRMAARSSSTNHTS